MTTNRSSRGPLNSNSDRSLRARYADGMARPRTSSGPAVSVPHQKAVHMTAPNRLVMIQNHPLPNRGRPHMTLPAPRWAGVSGENSSIGELHLVKGVCGLGFGEVYVWRFIDFCDWHAQKEAIRDETGQTNEGDFDEIFAGGETQK